MKRIVMLLFVLFCGMLFAVENDLRTVRSLADKGQFPAVEAFCDEKFQQDISDIDKVLLAVELVRSRSLQLLLVEPAQRTRIVRRLESLETDWFTVPTDFTSPSLALAKIKLRLQLAMAYRFLGDYQRLEADTVSETNKQAAYQQVRSTLQDALDRLKKCRQELQNFRQRIGNNAEPLLKQKMLALEYAITMQQGIAQKSLALTFSKEEERNFELQQAAETFSELTLLNSADPVIVQCKIEKAACHRLCGEHDRCKEILDQLSGIDPTPECRLQIEAEWIRYKIVTGSIAEARKQYAADRADSKLYPDFDLARLELFLANDPMRNIRPEVAAATKLQQTIEEQLGSYWGRRARMTASALLLGNTELNSAEILAMRAENHYRENRFTESAELYEHAAAKADANRQAENMFRFYRSAIDALRKALEHAPEESKTEYRNRLIVLLRKLAKQFPEHSEAPELHLSAIDLQRQIGLGQPELQNDYLILLQEHIETWTESPKLPSLHRQSVILLERQGRFNEAAAILPLLNSEQIVTLTPEMQRLRVRQLDTAGKTQEAVDLLKALLKQKREPATLQLFAEILTRQSDTESLNHALDFWRLLEQNTEKNSEIWWSAREGIIEVLCKLNRHEDARESFKMLPILYPGLGGAERKERLTRQFGN